MKRLLISAEYLANTGFSTVAENLIGILKPHFDITVLDYSRRHSYSYCINGVTVIANSSTLPNDTFGVDVIDKIVGLYDYFLIINDIWNIDTILTELRVRDNIAISPTRIYVEKKEPVKIVLYFPIDASQHSASWYKNTDIVMSMVTYTQFGYRVVKDSIEQGFGSKEHQKEALSKLSIIPHGVDTGSFFPLLSKRAARVELFNKSDFSNSFIVLNANYNQPRKRLDITMRAFASFLKSTNAKDAYLYMHTKQNGALDIYQYAKRLGIRDNLILSADPSNPTERTVFDLHTMNLLYNACDVGINTSMGEGWGLVSCEHAATGAPQIVPNHSACAEIFTEDEALFIDIKGEYLQDGINTLALLPSVESASYQINKLYWDRKMVANMGEVCADKFSKYSWSSPMIAGEWLKIFQSPI